MLFPEQIRCLCLAVVIVLGSAVSAFGMEVSFNQDVFPILSDRCFACHGPDAHDRKAKLRLDQADGEDGENGTAIYRLAEPIEVPGRYEYQVRAYPHHPMLAHPFETGLMRWL